MKRTTPPFRADMVGSLLRTAPLKEARERREKGEITPEQLKEVEDREIRGIIRKQEEIGLKAVTDGEFRRAFWHYDFLEHLDGVQGIWLDRGVQFKDDRALPVPEGEHQPCAEDDHPGPEHAPLPERTADDQRRALP